MQGMMAPYSQPSRWSLPMSKYTAFISGETCDLCIPNEQAIHDGWADWFNDPSITTWLDQGAFPNTAEDQQAFLAGVKRRERLALMVVAKGSGQLCGVISLSTIKPRVSAQIALVIPVKIPGKLIALEAMARMTEHAFSAMGLRRVWAGQAYPGLRSWCQRLELLGYRPEGIIREGFTKGNTITNSVYISCLYADYTALVESRGKFWTGNDEMTKLVAVLPKESAADRLSKFLLG